MPFLFTTLRRCWGTEDTKWWSVSGGILSHSFCKQVLRCPTVRGPRCLLLVMVWMVPLLFGLEHTASVSFQKKTWNTDSSTLAQLGSERTGPFLDGAFVPNHNCNHLLTSPVKSHQYLIFYLITNPTVPRSQLLLECAAGLNGWNGCIFTNQMKLTRQNMKYPVFIMSEMKVKVNLEITAVFFYLHFPYCPIFFRVGFVRSAARRTKLAPSYLSDVNRFQSTTHLFKWRKHLHEKVVLLLWVRINMCLVHIIQTRTSNHTQLQKC